MCRTRSVFILNSESFNMLHVAQKKPNKNLPCNTSFAILRSNCPWIQIGTIKPRKEGEILRSGVWSLCVCWCICFGDVRLIAWWGSEKDVKKKKKISFPAQPVYAAFVCPGSKAGSIPQFPETGWRNMFKFAYRVLGNEVQASLRTNTSKRSSQISCKTNTYFIRTVIYVQRCLKVEKT